MSDGMLVGVVILIIGVIFALIDIIMVILHKKKRKLCSVEVEATVAEVLRYWKRGADGPEHFYNAVYEYEYNGVKYSSESKMGTNAPPKVGKKRTIYLNPHNPKEYIEKRFLTYLHIVIVTGIGGLFGFIGLILILTGIL